MENTLPIRKHPRLKNFDYSSAGAYFITICTHNRKCLFSHIVGRALAPAEIRYTAYGQIAKEQLFLLEKRYPFLKIDQYVIMPNHIHMILYIKYDNGRMISSPTSILTVIGQMKRCVSKKIGEPIWQRSFHDHIIRDKNDYDKISKYIYENPIKWQDDCFYTED